MWNRIILKILTFLDSRLEKYRPKQSPNLTLKKPEKYTPKDLADFIDIIKRSPENVLSKNDKNRIAAVMSFESHIVSDLMVAKKDMVFVNEKDLLGPLMLDKLYKSGFTNFPVVDNDNKVKGIIHTEALNALEIKKTDRANKYMDSSVNYLHMNDSLKFAVEEIARTNAYYFLVLDEKDTLAGFFTVQILLDYLLK